MTGNGVWCNIATHFLPNDTPRLDRFLADCYPEPGRSKWSALVRAGQVKVDGKVVVKAATRLYSGVIVEACVPPPATQTHDLIPEDFNLPTIFEDEHLWIVDKPAGMVVHPSPGHSSGTVLNALLGRLNKQSNVVQPILEDDDKGGVVSAVWPGLVHRLDRYTTGCLAIAKDVSSQKGLQLQFKNRTVEKCYLALVKMSCNLPDKGFIQVDKPIARHKTNRLKMAVSAVGRPSQTRIKILARACNLALVECRPLTGRTHQIRLHLSHLGAPILGDCLYGGASRWLDADRHVLSFPHPMLHAWKLSINHPENGSRMHFSSPLSLVYKRVLSDLGILF